MRNIVFVLLLAMVFQFPWEALVILGTFGTLIHAVGIGAAILGFMAIFTTGRFRGLPLIHYWMIIFVLFAAVSVFWSMAVMDPFGKILTYVQLLMFSWLIWEFAPDSFRQKLLMHAYIWGSGLAVMLQFLGMRGYVKMPGTEERYAAGGMNPNEFGILLLTSIPLAIYCALDVKSNKLMRIAYLLYCPVCALSILLTGSRMAFVVMCAMAVMIGVVYFFKRPIFVLIFGFVAGTTFLFLFTRIMPEETWARLSTTYEEYQTGTMSGRHIINQAGLELHEQFPFLGTGCGSFRDMITRTIGAGEMANISAHNSYLDVLVELGEVGILLFIAIIITAGIYTFAMPFRERYTWRIVLVSWSICAYVTTLETNKLFWFILPMIACQYAIFKQQAMAKTRAEPAGVLDPRRQLLMRSRWGNTRGA